MGNAKSIRCDAVAEQAHPTPWNPCASARAHEFFGAHRTERGVVFRVWAPHADEVTVCGDFNAWSICANPMHRLGNGIWEAAVAGGAVREGQVYKYWIRNGRWSGFKADPYGFGTQRPPETGSVIWDLGKYSWRDGAWMRYRRERFTRQRAARQPINVYELHIGSWRRHEDGRPYTYRELASELIPYVKQMGYTHVELMPLAEHPFDGSWGYQVSGYYAPTSRYGTPEELMALVDSFHEAGVGVILDWVPGHFCKDPHGLADFDGQPLYEYSSVERMEHPVWGTRRFDLERQEVRDFLISNALFWGEVYHVDGLRVDAVSSMLYDSEEDRSPERACTAAVEFLRLLNRTLEREMPDVMTVAEESTGWPHVTGFEAGGLGFTMTWGMGWMRETRAYLQIDPLWRKYHHGKLTFPATYSFNERFMLALSHDEAAHGSGTLMDRAFGTYDQKFHSVRTFFLYMMTHPGKKLLFMGSEIGQFAEWDVGGSVEWFLLDYEKHARFQLFVAELNRLYLQYPALWDGDDRAESFCVIDRENADQNVYAYRRIDRKGEELVVVLNFCPVRREHFLLSVPVEGTYEEIFNSDGTRYGGEGGVNPGKRGTCRCERNGYGHAINITLPAMGGTIFRLRK